MNYVRAVGAAALGFALGTAVQLGIADAATRSLDNILDQSKSVKSCDVYEARTKQAFDSLQKLEIAYLRAWDNLGTNRFSVNRKFDPNSVKPYNAAAQDLMDASRKSQTCQFNLQDINDLKSLHAAESEKQRRNLPDSFALGLFLTGYVAITMARSKRKQE